ncbi:MAG TPA: GNAT family N-acetyltransferase [Vicinamibacterales bacterium]|nr:GNAT family N-acetyltransferase [Vicinamibacterales bacterium]
MSHVELETERLKLRMWCESDLDAYAEMCADPQVMRYLTQGKLFTRADAWRSIAFFMGHWQMRGYGHWAVEEKATGRMIGRIGFLNPEGWPGFEIGWTLASPTWGKGYATEGAKAALQYAFTELDRPHVISLIHPENASSIRVAERLGERLEGQTRIVDCDVLIYGIDRP